MHRTEIELRSCSGRNQGYSLGDISCPLSYFVSHSQQTPCVDTPSRFFLQFPVTSKTTFLRFRSFS